MLHSQLYALLNTCYSQAHRHISSDVRYMVARYHTQHYYSNQAMPVDMRLNLEVRIQCKTR